MGESVGGIYCRAGNPPPHLQNVRARFIVDGAGPVVDVGLERCGASWQRVRSSPIPISRGFEDQVN